MKKAISVGLLIGLFVIGLSYGEDFGWIYDQIKLEFDKVLLKGGESWRSWKEGCESLQYEFVDLRYGFKIISIDLSRGDQLNVLIQLKIVAFVKKDELKRRLISTRTVIMVFDRNSRKLLNGDILTIENETKLGWGEMDAKRNLNKFVVKGGLV